MLSSDKYFQQINHTHFLMLQSSITIVRSYPKISNNVNKFTVHAVFVSKSIIQPLHAFTRNLVHVSKRFECFSK